MEFISEGVSSIYGKNGERYVILVNLVTMVAVQILLGEVLEN